MFKFNRLFITLLFCFSSQKILAQVSGVYSERLRQILSEKFQRDLLPKPIQIKYFKLEKSLTSDQAFNLLSSCSLKAFSQISKLSETSHSINILIDSSIKTAIENQGVPSCLHSDEPEGSLLKLIFVQIGRVLYHSPMSRIEFKTLSNCVEEGEFFAITPSLNWPRFNPLNQECQILSEKKNRFKTDQRLTMLLNLYEKRSLLKVDPDDFAKHFSEYFLSPEESCKNIGVLKYFRDTFDIQTEVNCSVDFSFSWNQDSERTVKIQTRNIRFSEIIFVSPGESLLSRWGHIMFNFVACPPESSNDDCYQDRRNHFVYTIHLSAEQSGYSFSAFGQGKMNAYFAPFLGEFVGYKRSENRSFQALSLKLSRFELITLIDVLEHFQNHPYLKWNHLSSNCNTTTYKLLNAALSNKKYLDIGETLTPEQLFQQITSDVENSSYAYEITDFK